MAWVRAGQVSAETQSLAEYAIDTSIGGGAPNPSNAAAYTGNWSVRISGGSGNPSYPSPAGLAFAAANSVRLSFLLRHNGTLGSIARLIRIRATSLLAEVQVDNSNLTLFVGGTQRSQVSVSTANFNRFNMWMHIGFVYSNSAGFASMYIDGTQALTYSGIMPTENPTAAYAGGGTTGFNGWAAAAYWDDLFVDVWDNIGTLVDAPPPIRRFLAVFPNGVGSSAQWTPVGSASNWQNVDEAPPNNETDYNRAQAPNLLDLYAFGDVTVPTDHAVRAVIATAYARKSDAGVDSQARVAAKTGANTVKSDGKVLPVSYGYVWERWEMQPDGMTPWSEAAVNSAEFGIESAGTF